MQMWPASGYGSAGNERVTLSLAQLSCKKNWKLSLMSGREVVTVASRSSMGMEAIKKKRSKEATTF